jgi:hypothetical protein
MSKAITTTPTPLVPRIEGRIQVIRGLQVIIDADLAVVVTNCDHLQKLKFSKVLPFAFTEHGAIQAADWFCFAGRREGQARRYQSSSQGG